jgi:hypothetical protein
MTASFPVVLLALGPRKEEKKITAATKEVKG